MSLAFAHSDDTAYDEKDTLLVTINDDMPFLFDSLIAEVSATGGRLRAVFHPIIERDGQPVSVIVLVLEPVVSDAGRQALIHGAKATLAQVHVAVRDWHAMAARAREATDELKAQPPKVSSEELKDSIAFLECLGGDTQP